MKFRAYLAPCRIPQNTLVNGKRWYVKEDKNENSTIRKKIAT